MYAKEFKDMVNITMQLLQCHFYGDVQVQRMLYDATNREGCSYTVYY